MIKKILKAFAWILFFPFMLTYWGWKKDKKPVMIIGAIISMLFLYSGMTSTDDPALADTSEIEQMVVSEEPQDQLVNEITSETVNTYSDSTGNSETDKNDEELVEEEIDFIEEEWAGEDVYKVDERKTLNIDHNIVMFNGYNIQVPHYWKTDIVVEGGYRAYAETGEKVAVLRLSEWYDPIDDVNYEILYDEREAVFFNKTEGLSNVEIKDFKVFENTKSKGIMYKYNCLVLELEAEGAFLMFTIEDGNKYGTISVINTLNTEMDYISDFYQMIETIEIADNSTELVKEPEIIDVVLDDDNESDKHSSVDQTDKNYSEINLAIYKDLLMAQGWALGTLDGNGNPTNTGTPSPAHAFALYVMDVTYHGDKLRVSVTSEFKQLTDEEKSFVVNSVQNMSEYHTKKIPYTSVRVNGDVIGKSKVTNVKAFNWE